MTDYARANTGGATHFTDKDSKSTADPLKLIVGAQFDAEFNAIKDASATKLDSADYASTAEAEGMTSTAKIMSPNRVKDILLDQAGMLYDIQQLADPNADTLLGWDDSAGAVIGYTLHGDITHATTELGILWTGAHHDGFSDYVASEHVAHSGVSVIAGTGLTGGGTIDGEVTLNVVGDASITVAANSIGLATGVAGAGLTLGSGILAVGAGTGIAVAADAIAVDISGITAAEGNALTATGKILADVGGTLKTVAIQDMGLRVQAAQTTQNLALNDMNSIMVFTGSAPILTIQANATTDLPVGVPVVLNMVDATELLAVTADTGVTLVSINHPAGGVAATDHVSPGGTALLYQTADNTWVLSGDIQD